MGCNCNKNAPKATYVHTSPTGEVKTYSSEVEAKAAVARKGGTFRKK